MYVNGKIVVEVPFAVPASEAAVPPARTLPDAPPRWNFDRPPWG